MPKRSSGVVRFCNYDVVFAEIPGETTLAINIAGCPNRCPGCHSPLILLDEADASINRSRLDGVYQFLDSDATVILVTHRNTAHILQHYPEARVIHMEA